MLRGTRATRADPAKVSRTLARVGKGNPPAEGDELPLKLVLKQARRKGVSQKIKIGFATPIAPASGGVVLLYLRMSQTSRGRLGPHFWTQSWGGAAACARSIRKWR